MRIALIGDIGGHPAELRAALVGLGADAETLRLPDDLVVVQVGDLIDAGPDSTGVLGIAARQLTDRPGHWIQLVGNHEAAWIGGPAFTPFGVPATAADHEVISTWWARRRMSVACSLDAPRLGGPVLVTHAGLTRPLWQRIGRPQSSSTAARRLNALGHRAPERAFRPGAMLGGGPGQLDAGPVWAEPGEELLASWEGHTMPFSQVHGHASPWNWTRDCPASDHLPSDATIDRDRRHTWSPVGGRVIVGIDPDLYLVAGVAWAPLVVEGVALDSQGMA